MTRRRSLRLVLLFICTISVVAQELPKLSRPEEAGSASDRLNRIAQFFQSEVDKGAIPGAVLVVAPMERLSTARRLVIRIARKRSP